MTKVSVIVPVFNKEDYLRTCIDSVLSQTLDDIEIICIDDGSEDGSLEILDDYSNRYPNIRVFAQRNSGVGAARNLGIKNSKGEFVAFMDPDDYYPDDNVLETLYNAAKDNGLLASGGSFSSLIDGKVVTEYKGLFQGYVFTSDGVMDYSDYQYDYGFQRFIFSRELLITNGLRFPNYIRFQDPPFFVRAMQAAGRFYAVSTPTYRYRESYKEVGWNVSKKIDLLNGIDSNIVFAAENGLSGLRDLEYSRLTSDYDHNLIIKGNSYAESLMLADRLAVIRSHMPPDYDTSALDGIISELEVSKSAEHHRVSVVVPVYNVTDYLEECLDSLVNQVDMDDMEVILVDDGSTDDSGTICDRYAKSDSRFTVIHKINGGLSSARNAGAERAVGDYLYFLDSDDYLSPDALASLYSVMKENSLDALFFDAEVFFESEEIRQANRQFEGYYSNRAPGYEVTTGPELLKRFLDADKYRTPVQLCIVSKEYYDRTSLDNCHGILHEDNLFTFRCLLDADRVMYVPVPYYHRRIRGASIMTMGKSFKNVYGYVRCCEEMEKWASSRKDVPEEAHILIDKARKNYAAVSAGLPTTELSKYNDMDLFELAEYATDTDVCLQVSDPVVDVFYTGEYNDRLRASVSRCTFSVTLTEMPEDGVFPGKAPFIAIVPCNADLEPDCFARAIVSMRNDNLLSVEFGEPCIRIYARGHELDKPIRTDYGGVSVAEDDSAPLESGIALDEVGHKDDTVDDESLLLRMSERFPRYRRIYVKHLLDEGRRADAIRYARKQISVDGTWLYRCIDIMIGSDDQDDILEGFRMITDHAVVGDRACCIRYGRLALAGTDGFDIEKAVSLMKKVVDRDSADYCRVLSDVCLTAGDAEGCYSAALAGSDMGDAYCMGRLARCYRDGTGTPRDLRKAVESYTSAHLMGCSWAFTDLALMLSSCQDELPKDIDIDLSKLGIVEAVLETEESEDDLDGSSKHNHTVVIDSDHDNAVAEYADYLYTLGGEDNLRECLSICEYLSGKGNKDALFRLAQIYRNGRGVDKDMSKAAQYMKQAIEHGHKGAIRELEIMYPVDTELPLPEMEHEIEILLDAGTEDTLMEAVNLCFKCSERGSTFANLCLARAFRYGKGVQNDDVKARHYYEKTDAIPEFSEYLYSTRDYTKCMEVSRSCPDNKDCLFRIAQMYRNGNGVEKDILKATAWMILACESGHKGAVKELDSMLVEKTPSDNRKDLIMAMSDFGLVSLDSDDSKKLATCLRDGLGIAFLVAGRVFVTGKEYFIAGKMFEKAASKRIKGAKKELDNLRNLIS